MARKKRSRRKSPKVRTRTITKRITRWRSRPAAAKRSRRRGGGGGLSPFRTSGSLSSRVQGSALPFVRLVVPVVLGAVGGAIMAKAAAPRVGGNPVKTGAVVSLAALLAGIFAGKLGRMVPFITPRAVQAFALGGGADGVMRILAPLRASGKLPGLPRGNAGLLGSGRLRGADAPDGYSPPYGDRSSAAIASLAN